MCAPTVGTVSLLPMAAAILALTCHLKTAPNVVPLWTGTATPFLLKPS